MARLVAEEGLDLDVATGGELHVALHAGFPAERIVFHGNNKSDDELRARGRSAGVGRIVVDSFDELDRLERARGERRAGARAARARDARRRSAHARVHRDRHRGLEVRVRARERRRARARCSASSTSRSLRVRGHALPHRVAGVPRSTRSRRAVDKMVGLVRADRERRRGATVDELNLGGGLGVRYLAERRRRRRSRSTRASLQEAFAKALADARRAVAARA